MSECAPSKSEIDRRILFEMTGVKLDPNDYQDESSFEEDLSLLISNVIGYDFSESNDLLPPPPSTSAAVEDESPITPLLSNRS